MRALRGLVGLVGALAACDAPPDPRQQVPGGDAGRGRELVAALACGACHEIPGVAGARGIVGPSLRGFARRGMIGGVQPNRPGMLMAWVQNAPRFSPRTAMPRYALEEAEARDVAAFLYTLR